MDFSGAQTLMGTFNTFAIYGRTKMREGLIPAGLEILEY
jgi:hypothetical protein